MKLEKSLALFTHFLGLRRARPRCAAPAVNCSFYSKAQATSLLFLHERHIQPK